MKTLTLIAALAVATPVAAQTTTKPAEKMEHHGSSNWKELDAFHAVLAATWHPVSGSGDFTAIRAQSDSLAATAQRWASSKIPAGCDRKEIRDAIAAVVKGSGNVAALVARKATDSEVKTALGDVHTKFEVVEMGCH